MKIVKFFGSSVIATTTDFLLYLALINALTPAVSHAISAAVGLIINFILQYRYVFTPTNTLRKAILLTLCFSACGVLLGTAIIYLLTGHTPLAQFPVVAKVITVAVIFFYNFFTRKIAFGDIESRHRRQERPW